MSDQVTGVASLNAKVEETTCCMVIRMDTYIVITNRGMQRPW